MSSNDVAIRVQSISKRYEIYASPRDRLNQFVRPPLQRLAGRPPKQYFREFWALKDVSFEVKKGETLGIIGRNGSGKSTLLQLICGTLTPTGGNIQTNGRIAALLELGSGFNPEFTGRENVFINGTILGLSETEISDHFDDIASFADIGEFIDQPVKTYSSGMFVRLAFAVQAHIDASIVIIDEALTVGDVFFRQKCYTRLEQLRSSGAAILLVSHSMPDIEQYCERAILLDHGKQLFTGASTEASKHYYLLHQAETRILNKPTADPTTVRPPVDGGIPIDRPPPEAFIDLSNKSQINNGQARCVGVALCDEAGQACNSFRQSDLAVFYYEFELSEDIGVPICGIVISNDRGTIVHGKNSWQFEDGVSETQGAGSKVSCRHEIKLDLGPGEYVFEIGLASVSGKTWHDRAGISHEEMAVRHVRNCHIANVGSFSVGLALKNGVSVLTHHGIADLPGKMRVSVARTTSEIESTPSSTIRRSIGVTKRQEEQPTIFHVTHWKAGSQWLYKILREIALDRIIVPVPHEKQFLNNPLIRSAIYPTVYVTWEQFHSVTLPDNYQKFVVIRDLRDTLVSGYFSFRYSHSLIAKGIALWRDRLDLMSIEEGLLMLMDEFLPGVARIQESWIERGEKFVRYEDLLTKDCEILEDVLLGHCGISVTPERLREVVMANRFESLTGGRKSGVEEIMAHERKGIAGDWQNRFTPLVTEKFNERYGSLLIDSGYALTDLRTT